MSCDWPFISGRWLALPFLDLFDSSLSVCILVFQLEPHEGDVVFSKVLGRVRLWEGSRQMSYCFSLYRLVYRHASSQILGSQNYCKL